jgi:hypothetical protein
VSPIPLTTNKQKEDAAIAWVIDYEKKVHARTARDTRRRAPTDIESPPLKIEVKAFGLSARGNDLWLEPPQFQAASDPNFRLYIVENVAQGDPAQFTLRVIEGELLAEMVARSKQRTYHMLPWSTTIYDNMPVERIP